MGDEPHQPEELPDERRDAAARRGDLERMAREAEDATYGVDAKSRARVPGVISGDLGPKGTVASQHRALSRAQRAARSEVPRGTVAPGGGLLVLVPMLAIAFVLIAIVALLGWLLS